MFKKFNPKEDIASSTSIKSSIQRGIRNALLTQYPFLSSPAELPPPSASAAHADDSDSDDEPVTLTKKGGKGKGGKKGGKGGKGRGREEEEEKEEEKPEEEQEEVLTVLDVIWPKKEGLTLVKGRDHLSLLVLHSEPLFFQHFDGPYFPTLKILHKYPEMLPKLQVDRGAIKFVLSGANIMCPGLTSSTALLPTTNVPKGTPVAIHAHGKEHALAIGLLMMSTDEIKSINKGVGVDNVVFLGDDLWAVKGL
ncbi:hypothetical protein T439DRAFT_329507 [Meredithblackwellia eburnea MCA 4105]